MYFFYALAQLSVEVKSFNFSTSDISSTTILRITLTTVFRKRRALRSLSKQ